MTVKFVSSTTPVWSNKKAKPDDLASKEAEKRRIKKKLKHTDNESRQNDKKKYADNESKETCRERDAEDEKEKKKKKKKKNC